MATEKVSLTTTLSELNRLYGLYCAQVNKKNPNLQDTQKAWIEYETYARRYKQERGLKVTLEPRPRI